MILVLKPRIKKEMLDKIKMKMKSLGCNVHEVIGESRHVLALIGDTSRIDKNLISANIHVD